MTKKRLNQKGSSDGKNSTPKGNAPKKRKKTNGRKDHTIILAECRERGIKKCGTHNCCTGCKVLLEMRRVC
jgi:hypothetical protein